MARQIHHFAALLNAIILLITVGAIGIEALQRLREPEVLQAKSVAIVAAIGIFINAFTAWQFFTNKDKDINIKGAYLHLATDALVSMGVVIAGILIYYTHWYWLDSAVSLIIMIVVFLSTWGLMKESFKLSMDGVPHGVSINEVQKVLMTANITSYHHLHIWAISSSENALTAHIVVPDFKTNHALKKDLKHKLLHENIHHATFEFELQEENCEEWEHSK